MDFGKVLALGQPVSLALLMFATGMACQHGEVSAVLRQPALLLRSITAMQLLSPVVVLGLMWRLPLDPVVTVALLTVAVSPAPLFTPREEPNAVDGRSYAVSLIATSALLSVIIVPGALSVLSDVVAPPLRIPAMALTQHLAVVVLLPFLAGLLLAHVAPGLSAVWASAVGDAAVLVFAGALVPQTVAALPALRAMSARSTVVGIVTYAAATLIIGHLLGGPKRENRETLALATTVRHPAFALFAVNASFDHEPLAVPAVLLVALVTLATALPYIVMTRLLRFLRTAGVARTPTGQHPRHP